MILQFQNKYTVFIRKMWILEVLTLFLRKKEGNYMMMRVVLLQVTLYLNIYILI